MGRIFTLLSAIAVIMILAAAGGVYWLSTAEIENSKRNATASLAKGVALGINAQISLLNRTLDNMVTNPELIKVVASGNQALLQQTEARFAVYLPEIMNIGIFLSPIATQEQSEAPHLGYADLDLVREAFKKKQPMMVQGKFGPDRHLAIARRIINNDQVIGVLLASLQYQFLINTVTAATLQEGLISLKQGSHVMATSGNKKLLKSDESKQINITNTGWVIQYWYPQTVDFQEFTLLVSIILIPCLLASLGFYVGYHKFLAILHQDQGSVLKVIKDLLTGSVQGNYPVSLNEMRSIISTAIQFKRVLDHESGQSESVYEVSEDDKELGLADFLNDNFDQQERINNQQEKPVASNLEVPGIPVSLPDMEDIKTKKATEKPLGHPIKEQGTPVSLPDTEEAKNSSPATFAIPESPQNTDPTAAIFRAYDIRGIVGNSLTKELVYDIGRAIGSEAKEKACKCVVIARDGRISSPALSDSLAQGILSTGLDILDLGMVPTPVLYFVTHHHQGHTGVMITGSHNPANYNGLKIVVNAETLAGEKIQKLKQRIDKGDFASGESGNLGTNNLLVNEYIGIISEDIHLGRPMKVVVDSGNGVAGELGPTLLKTLGCDVIELYCEIDGNFPNHHPDPSKTENLADLISSVKHYEADLGIAFDGDGDRLGVVDCQGKIIWPDRLMMLFCKEVLTNNLGAEIIFDVKCSKHLPEQIVKQGGRPLMWKTGHSLMKAKIKETGAKLAGEMSGHIFFNDRWFGFDDALYSASRLIEILSADSRSSNEVFADFPDSFNTPELNVELAEGENFLFITELIKSANFPDGKIIDIDGLRVDFPDGWGLVRASNTMPALVIRFEADTKVALSKIQDQFKQLMIKIKPDISLPF